MDVVRVLDFYS